MARVLRNEHILVRFIGGAYLRLSLEDCHLRNLLVDTTAITLGETLVTDVPVKQVTLVASCEKIVTYCCHTERNLVLGVQICDQAQVLRGQDIQRLVRTIDCDMLVVQMLH